MRCARRLLVEAAAISQSEDLRDRLPARAGVDRAGPWRRQVASANAGSGIAPWATGALMVSNRRLNRRAGSSR